MKLLNGTRQTRKPPRNTAINSIARTYAQLAVHVLQLRAHSGGRNPELRRHRARQVTARDRGGYPRFCWCKPVHRLQHGGSRLARQCGASSTTAAPAGKGRTSRTKAARPAGRWMRRHLGVKRPAGAGWSRINRQASAARNRCAGRFAWRTVRPTSTSTTANVKQSKKQHFRIRHSPPKRLMPRDLATAKLGFSEKQRVHVWSTPPPKKHGNASDVSTTSVNSGAHPPGTGVQGEPVATPGGHGAQGPGRRLGQRNSAGRYSPAAVSTAPCGVPTRTAVLRPCSMTPAVSRRTRLSPIRCSGNRIIHA